MFPCHGTLLPQVRARRRRHGTADRSHWMVSCSGPPNWSPTATGRATPRCTASCGHQATCCESRWCVICAASSGRLALAWRQRLRKSGKDMATGRPATLATQNAARTGGKVSTNGPTERQAWLPPQTGGLRSRDLHRSTTTFCNLATMELCGAARMSQRDTWPSWITSRG